MCVCGTPAVLSFSPFDRHREKRVSPLGPTASGRAAQTQQPCSPHQRPGGEGRAAGSPAVSAAPPDEARGLSGLLPSVAGSALSADAPHLHFSVKFPALRIGQRVPNSKSRGSNKLPCEPSRCSPSQMGRPVRCGAWPVSSQPQLETWAYYLFAPWTHRRRAPVLWDA